MLFGEGSETPRATGRARVQPRVRGGLAAGATGLMPSARYKGRSGVASPPPPTSSSSNQRDNVRAGLVEASNHPQGRRHLEPHHFTNLSDVAKRAEGRCGRAHVATSEQQKSEDAFYATRQPTVAQPPGSDCNLCLTSYLYTPLSKMDSLSSRPRQQPTGLRMDAQSTSFQLAEARLHQIQREHPEYAAEVAQALQDNEGKYSIVPTEKKISRNVAVDAYAEGSPARLAEIEASTKYHGAPDLGAPTPRIERTVPYALDGSTPRPDTGREMCSHVRMYPGHNRCSSSPPPPPPSDRVRRDGLRRVRDGRIPFDNVDVSGNAYPSPPTVGEQRGLYSKPMMVHVVEQRKDADAEDYDSIALKRARARGDASVSQERPDFIFGPGPQLPARQPTLRSRTEARWKTQELQAEQRRTGRVAYPQAYRSTSLW